jgi:hypothetical protein
MGIFDLLAGLLSHLAQALLRGLQAIMCLSEFYQPVKPPALTLIRELSEVENIPLKYIEFFIRPFKCGQ